VIAIDVVRNFPERFARPLGPLRRCGRQKRGDMKENELQGVLSSELAARK